MILFPGGTPILGKLGILALLPALLPALLLPPPQGAGLPPAAGKLEIRSSSRELFVGQRFGLVLRLGIRRDLYPTRLVQPFRRPLGLPVQVQAPWLLRPKGFRILPQKSPEGLGFLFGKELARAHPLESPSSSPYRWFEARFQAEALQPGEQRLRGTVLRFLHAETFREDLVQGTVPEDPKTETLPAPPLTLRIRTLPQMGETSPKGRVIPFSGGVGEFRIQASLEPTPNEDPFLRLHLEILGEGNLSRVRPPRLQDLPAFRPFHVLGLTRNLGPESLSFVYELIPLGEQPAREIPPIPFSYFDPSPPAGYQVVQSDPIPLPEAIPPKALPPVPSSRQGPPLQPKTLLVFLTLAQALLLGGLLFWKSRRRPGLLLWTLLGLSLIPEFTLLPSILRSPHPRVLILQDGCPLLPGPHRELPVLRKLRRGALLELIEGSDRWLRVRDASGQGWVSRSAGRVDHL